MSLSVHGNVHGIEIHIGGTIMEDQQTTEPQNIEPTPTQPAPPCIEIAKALCEVQKTELFAITDSVNPYHNSKYADLSSVWSAIRKPLTDNGLSILQTTEPYEGGVTVVTTLLHVSGESIETRLSAKVPTKKDKNGQDISNVQSLGSAITYLRRYSLAAMIGVCPADDDGEVAMGRTKENHPASNTAKEAPQKTPAKQSKKPPKPKSINVHGLPKGKTLFACTFPDKLEDYNLGEFDIKVREIAGSDGTHWDVSGSAVYTDKAGNFYSVASGFMKNGAGTHASVIAAILEYGAEAVTAAFPNVKIQEATK